MDTSGARNASVVAVDGSRRSSFDGNHTSSVMAWFVCTPDGWDGIPLENKEMLLRYTEGGHLSWVVFPVPR